MLCLTLVENTTPDNSAMANTGGFPAQQTGDFRRDQEVKRGTPKLTEDEIRVLKECNFESLWFRCVPLSIALMGTTQYLVKIGYLTAHPKYGTVFKNLAAMFVGYLAGKLSYQNTCRQKILTKIPNSRLAHAVMGKQETAELIMTTGEPEVSGIVSNPVREFTLEIDTNRSSSELSKELDDNFRPTVDREIRKRPSDEGDESFRFTSYDELRRRNRMEYEKKAPVLEKKAPTRRTSRQPGWSGGDTAQPPKIERKKNVYGDEWDE